MATTPCKTRRPYRQAAFLAAYAVCGTVRRAAEVAGVRRECHCRWLRNPLYRIQFELAQEEASDRLEEEARRRAEQGLKRFRFYKGEPILDPETKKPYFELEYSDALMTVLLKGNKPEKFRDNQHLEHVGPGGGPLRVRLAADYTDNELAAILDAVAQDVAQAGGPGLPVESEAGPGDGVEVITEEAGIK